MSEPASSVVAGVLAKMFPAAMGALIMIAVDTPETKKEWFLRIFVALACSWAFYGITFDGLRSLPWLTFMDKANEDHQFAVRTLLGATGWFLMGTLSMMLRVVRKKATADAEEIKKGFTP